MPDDSPEAVHRQQQFEAIRERLRAAFEGCELPDDIPELLEHRVIRPKLEAALKPLGFEVESVELRRKRRVDVIDAVVHMPYAVQHLNIHLKI